MNCIVSLDEIPKRKPICKKCSSTDENGRAAFFIGSMSIVGVEQMLYMVLGLMQLVVLLSLVKLMLPVM